MTNSISPRSFEAIDRISRWLNGIDTDRWNDDDMLRAEYAEHKLTIERIITETDELRSTGCPAASPTRPHQRAAR